MQIHGSLWQPFLLILCSFLHHFNYALELPSAAGCPGAPLGWGRLQSALPGSLQLGGNIARWIMLGLCKFVWVPLKPLQTGVKTHLSSASIRPLLWGSEPSCSCMQGVGVGACIIYSRHE